MRTYSLIAVGCQGGSVIGGSLWWEPSGIPLRSPLDAIPGKYARINPICYFAVFRYRAISERESENLSTMFAVYSLIFFSLVGLIFFDFVPTDRLAHDANPYSCGSGFYLTYRVPYPKLLSICPRKLHEIKKREIFLDICNLFYRFIYDKCTYFTENFLTLGWFFLSFSDTNQIVTYTRTSCRRKRHLA